VANIKTPFTTGYQVDGIKEKEEAVLQ